MSLFARVANLIQIKTQQLLSRHDTPETTAAHAYEQLLVSLQDAKLHRAEIMAEQRGLDEQIASGEPACAAADAEARTAIEAGDDDAARQAFARKQVMLAKLAPIHDAQASLAAQAAKLAEYETMLETRIEQLRLERNVGHVGTDAALAQLKAGRALAGMSTHADAADRTPGLAQAKAEAIDRMLHSGAIPDPYDHRSETERELAALRASNAADAELERLKAEIAAKKQGG
jgi:phage shock protein A